MPAHWSDFGRDLVREIREARRSLLPTTIVVVSRDASLAPAVRCAFGRRRPSVLRARDAADALRLARSGANLVMIDLDAPRLPVRGLLDRLALRAPSASTVLVAGRKGFARAATLARERGAEVVTKPVAGPRLRRAANLSAKRRAVEEESRVFVDRLVESNRLLTETQSQLRRKVLAINEEVLALQELNASIFQNMGWGLLVIDAAGRVTRINRAASEILAVAERDALGRPASDVFATGDGTLFERALGGEPLPYDVEVAARAGDDGRVPLLLRTSLLRAADGTAAGLVVLFSDLTRLKAQDRELRRVERLASLGELSAGMAHEIRNPLAGIEATAELLGKRMPEADPGRDLVAMIIDEVRRLNRLIEDLLRFARPGAPQFVPQPIGEILDRCLALLARSAQAKRLSVARALGADLPAVFVDPSQMTQVFLNVIKNAIEASPSAGVLTLGAELAAEDGCDGAAGPGGPARPSYVLRVRIADRGPGIPAENLERIWDPFFTTKSTGTGLGLPICQRIVADHRGRITIASEPGKGTEVVVLLPVPFYGERERELPLSEAIDRLSTIYG